MKKRLMALVMIAMLSSSIVLTGCKNDKVSTTTVPKSSEKVVIKTTLYTNEVTDQNIKDFESKNPNIKIEVVAADDIKLMAMIASGNAPDIIRLLGVQQLPTYISRGLALNLDKYIDKSTVIKKDDFLPVVNAYKYDGKQTGSGSFYGLPKDWSFDQTLFLNKKIFADAGVAIPDSKKPLTYTELFEIAKKVTKKTGDKMNVVGLDGADSIFTLANAQFQLQQMGKSLWSNDYKTVNLNNADVKGIFDRTNALIQTKSIYSPINPNPSGWFGPAFAEGKLAIVQAGYWFSGFIRSDEKTKNNLDNYIMLPAPVVDGGKRYSAVTSATGAIILKQSKHPDEAYKVFEYIFGGDPVDQRSKAGWGLPIYKSKMALLPQATAFDKECYDVTQDEIKNGNSEEVLKYNPYLNSSAVTGLLDKLLTPNYFGKATTDDSFTELQKQVQALVGEGMDIVGAK